MLNQFKTLYKKFLDLNKEKMNIQMKFYKDFVSKCVYAELIQSKNYDYADYTICTHKKITEGTFCQITNCPLLQE